MLKSLETLLFLSILMIFCQSQVEPYSYIGSTTSGVIVLYNDSNTAMVQGNSGNSFSINYASPKLSNPELLIGLYGYQQKGDMSNSYIKITIASSTLTAFTIQVITAGTSLVYFMQISYISIEDSNNAFYFIQYEYPLSTVSTGTGNRVQSKLCNFYTLTGGGVLNSSMSMNKAYIFITGFQMQTTSGNCYLSTEISIQNTISYEINIRTKFQCRVQLVKGTSVLINIGKFNSPKLYVYDNIVSFSSPTIFSALPLHYSSFGHTFVGFNKWRLTNTRDINSRQQFILGTTSANFTMSASASVQTVEFTYIFIALNVCMSTYPFFVNSTKLACVSQCYSTETQFPANSICIACTSPCLSCYSVQNNCTTCIDGYEISSDNSCIFKTEITEGSKLYLLGLLGLIPILIILLYFITKRRKYTIMQRDMMAQPSINIT